MPRLVSRVRKRDGSEESFDGPRLADSLRAAVHDALPDDGWAEQMVETIRVQLGPREASVETTELARTAVRVLRSCGLDDAARAYRSFRRELERAVTKLRVHTRQGRDQRTRPWDRARLALSLVRDRYLEIATARRIAALAERRLIMADLGHVTGRLVSSLADNECRALGLRSDPLATEAVGVDRRELRAWLGGDCLPSMFGAPRLGPSGGDPRPVLGEELLARFALEEVLSPPYSEALALGQFAIPGIGDWMRPARVLLQRLANEDEAEFWARVRADRGVARELQVFVPHQAEWTSLSEQAPQWLQGGQERMRFSTAHVELALCWAAQDVWVQMPAASFAQASEQQQAALAQCGRVVLNWSPPRRLPPVEELKRSCIDRFAVVNLARAALEAGPLDVVNFQEEVIASLELACRSLVALAKRAGSSEHPKAVLLPGGLSAAMRTLFPDESPQSDRVRRLCLSLRACFENKAADAGLRVEHAAPPHAASIGLRLAELDGLPPERAYSCDWSLRSEDGLPAPSAFDSAPWLEFPAAAAWRQESWLRHLPQRSDLAGP